MTDGHSLFPNTNCKITSEDCVDAKCRCNLVKWEFMDIIFKIRIICVERIIFKIGIIFVECKLFKIGIICIKRHSIMARQPHASRAGRGGGGRGGQGGRFPIRKEPSSLPCKGSEVGACKDLEGNVFTIGSGNKGKEGDMLRTSKEKLALYIGTNYGDDACQEWLSEKQLVLQEPTYLDAVLARHRLREIAVTDRVTKMITSLEKQL